MSGEPINVLAAARMAHLLRCAQRVARGPADARALSRFFIAEVVAAAATTSTDVHRSIADAFCGACGALWDEQTARVRVAPLRGASFCTSKRFSSHLASGVRASRNRGLHILCLVCHKRHVYALPERCAPGRSGTPAALESAATPAAPSGAQGTTPAARRTSASTLTTPVPAPSTTSAQSPSMVTPARSTPSVATPPSRKRKRKVSALAAVLQNQKARIVPPAGSPGLGLVDFLQSLT